LTPVEVRDRSVVGVECDADVVVTEAGEEHLDQQLRCAGVF
jgi:hypothetical protein